MNELAKQVQVLLTLNLETGRMQIQAPEDEKLIMRMLIAAMKTVNEYEPKIIAATEMPPDRGNNGNH